MACRAEVPLEPDLAPAPRLPSAPFEPRNVILISIDTLRADHLGCYGYARETSPRIDRLAAESVLFELAIAQAPSTLPSHASMFSSLWPAHHGAYFMRREALPPSVLTLAEVLRENGYRTAAFTGGGQMAPEFGLDQGFDLYEVLGATADTGQTVKRAAEWLAEGGEPFFLFVHTYEVHHPYTPRGDLLARFAGDYRGDLGSRISKELLLEINAGERRIDEDDLAYIAAAYDAEIFSMDAAVGRLLDILRERGLYDDSILVLTSDHGEELGEHGTVGWHSHTLYDELLKVPLIIKLPGSRHAGARVGAQVRSIDISPTILELLHLGPRAEFEGVGLESRMEDPDGARHLPAISQQDTGPEADHTSLRTGRWKLYPNRLFEISRVGDPQGGSPRNIAGRLRYYWARANWATAPDRLFDVAGDPQEEVDVAGRERAVRRRLQSLRASLLEARNVPERQPATPDEETLERLRALGYVD
ncbi:MAG: sulfatase [bacterium]|nr:sulfatase [bacterium]